MVIGIAAGACFAVLIVLIRTHFTKLNQLGKLLQSEIYETTDLFPKVDLDDNIIVLSYNAPIDYLNVKFFKKSMLRILRRKINDPTALEITEFELATFDPDQTGSNQTSPAVSGNKGIVLDCSGIKFVDSVGVDGIVKILQEFEKSNWNFVFSNCTDDFLRSFSSVASFEILLRSFPTVHEAVLYLKTL
uniref:STAS domain-containing protein n=1 Tax=Ciona savignyi TaxID=51511 RepID=H2ZMV8_CIOSA